MFVSENGRITLDVSIDRLCLVEFDLETQRPATVIIVPQDPRDAPRQLGIEPQQDDEVASVLAQLGPRIEGSARTSSQMLRDWPGYHLLRDSFVLGGRPLQKLVAEIMAAWRRAERLTQSLPMDSAEREAAERASERLRDAYQELTHSGVAAALTAAEAKLLLRDAASDVDPS